VKPDRAPLLHFETNDPALDRLLKPGTAYSSPDDVVSDPGLTRAEKKAILASWASDACAVESRPDLRHPVLLATPVSFDAIMMALQELDRGERDVLPRAPHATPEDRSPLC
jgi:hypothetical protein